MGVLLLVHLILSAMVDDSTGLSNEGFWGSREEGLVKGARASTDCILHVSSTHAPHDQTPRWYAAVQNASWVLYIQHSRIDSLTVTPHAPLQYYIKQEKKKKKMESGVVEDAHCTPLITM